MTKTASAMPAAKVAQRRFAHPKPAHANRRLRCAPARPAATAMTSRLCASSWAGTSVPRIAATSAGKASATTSRQSPHRARCRNTSSRSKAGRACSAKAVSTSASGCACASATCSVVTGKSRWCTIFGSSAICPTSAYKFCLRLYLAAAILLPVALPAIGSPNARIGDLSPMERRSRGILHQTRPQIEGNVPNVRLKRFGGLGVAHPPVTQAG